MTYLANNTIQAADYNNFAGLTGSVAASAAIATAKAGYLYGVGFGDRGYGQTAPALSAVSVGQSVGQEWQNLRTVMASLASWQGTSAATLPASGSFNAGAAITAHSAISTLLSTLDSNRLNYQAGNMSLGTMTSSTRASTWGGGTGSITCEFQITFSSEDHARYFFNTGGELRVSLNHPSTATARDISWNTILSGLNVAFRANTSARIGGSYGTAVGIGYYQLTTTYQTILNGTNSGTGAYTVNDFVVQARATSIAGVNGAKGSVIQIRVILTDEQTNAFQDIVQSGTSATLQQLRATSVFPVATPSASVVTAF